MYLFFDTETTGLPKRRNAPVHDLDNWPRLVQLAFLLYDKRGNKVEGGDYIVKPEGFTIPSEAANIHGISTQKVLKEGQPLITVLLEFEAALKQAKILVAHNMAFDQNVVGAELLRAGFPNYLERLPKICTMRRAANFCAIPSSYWRF
jgi:DNA polymerase III epsilon subunit-like protein